MGTTKSNVAYVSGPGERAGRGHGRAPSAVIRACAASAAIALAGSAQGFVVSQVAIVPEGEIKPDMGSFVTQFTGYENFFLQADLTINRDYSTWGTYLSYVQDTTYLALDPQGPVSFQGVSDTGPMGEPGLAAPQGTDTLSSGAGLEAVAGTGLATRFYGGSAGAAYSAGPEDEFKVTSEMTSIGGAIKDSVFIGQFIVDTPGAVLTGDDLYIVVDTGSGFEGKYVPLSGSYYLGKSAGTEFALSYVREPAGANAPAGSERILAYLAPVPAPGPGVALGVGGAIVLSRRRRRG